MDVPVEVGDRAVLKGRGSGPVLLRRDAGDVESAGEIVVCDPGEIDNRVVLVVLAAWVRGLVERSRDVEVGSGDNPVLRLSTVALLGADRAVLLLVGLVPHL